MEHWILSIKPVYSALILRCEKTVELRRGTCAGIQPGDWLWLYATRPVKAIVGRVRVEEKLHFDHPDSPAQDGLWLPMREYYRRWGKLACLNYEEFHAYLYPVRGAMKLTVLRLAHPKERIVQGRLPEGVRPPQSYMRFHPLLYAEIFSGRMPS